MIIFETVTEMQEWLDQKPVLIQQNLRNIQHFLDQDLWEEFIGSEVSPEQFTSEAEMLQHAREYNEDRGELPKEITDPLSEHWNAWWQSKLIVEQGVLQ